MSGSLPPTCSSSAICPGVGDPVGIARSVTRVRRPCRVAQRPAGAGAVAPTSSPLSAAQSGGQQSRVGPPRPPTGRRAPVPRPLQGGRGGNRVRSSAAAGPSPKQEVKGRATGPLTAAGGLAGKPETDGPGQNVSAKGENETGNETGILLSRHVAVPLQTPDEVPECRELWGHTQAQEGLDPAKKPDSLMQGLPGVWRVMVAWTAQGESATASAAIGAIRDEVADRPDRPGLRQFPGVKTTRKHPKPVSGRPSLTTGGSQPGKADGRREGGCHDHGMVPYPCVAMTADRTLVLSRRSGLSTQQTGRVTRVPRSR